MKNNKLLIIGTAIALAISGIAGVASRKASAVYAADQVYKTARFGSDYNIINSSYTSSFEATNENFVVVVNNFNNNNNGWTNASGYGQIKCGRKNNASTGIITTKAAIDAEITKVNVTIDAITSSSVNSIKLYTSSNGTSWTEAGTYEKTTGEKSVTLTSPTANLYYKVEFDCASASSNGVITVSKLEYIKESAGNIDPNGISINKSSVVIGKDGGYQLTATILPSGATGDIFWESSNNSVVEVDDSGNITGMSVGTATITASVSGTNLSATCGVEVVNYGTQANPLTVAEAKAALDKTGANVTNQPLYVAGTVSGNDAYNTTYNNYNSNVHLEGGFDLYRATFADGVTPPANYQTAGALSGCEVVAYGYGKIHNGTYELCEASGKNPAKPQIVQIETPQNIALITSELTIEVGDDVQIEFTLPNGVSASDVSWESDDETIAEVDQYGIVTGMSIGTTTITGQLNDLTPVECEVEIIAKQNYGTVENPITVAQAKAILDITNGAESRHPLTVRGVVSSNKAYDTTYNNFSDVYLEDGFDLFRVKFDTGVTLEDSYKAANGMKDYTVVAYGYGKIHSGTYELTPSTEVANPLIKSITPPAATGISLSPSTAEVEAGKTVTLTASFTPSNAVSPITWESDDEAIATVDDGVVTGVAVGTTTITASISENIYAECDVTVTEPVVEPDSVTFDLSKDETTTASATEISWVATGIGTVICEKGNASTATNNYYPGTSGQSYTSTRFYKNSVLSIKPHSGISFTSIEFVATTNGYAGKLAASTWANATATADDLKVTVVPEDGSANISATISDTCGFTSIKLFYEEDSSTISNPQDYLDYCNSIASIHGVETASSSTEGHPYSTTFSKLGYAHNEQITGTYIGPVALAFGKGSNNTAPAYNSNNKEARIYVHNTFTFSYEEGIDSITFTLSDDSGTDISCSAGSLNGNVWTGGNISSVTFTNDGSTQVHIKSIEVVCKQSISINSVALRFGAEISKADWASLNDETKQWSVDKYGVMLATKAAMDYYCEGKTIAEAYKDGERRFTKVESANGDAPFPINDNYYAFTAKVNISGNHDKEYVAAPFIVVNGEYYFLDEMTYSVNSLAAEYLKSPIDYPNVSRAALSILAND